MNKVILISSLLLLLFAGCAKEDPKAEMKQSPTNVVETTAERMKDKRYLVKLGSAAKARNAAEARRDELKKRIAAGEKNLENELKGAEADVEAAQRNVQGTIRARILKGASKQ